MDFNLAGKDLNQLELSHLIGRCWQNEQPQGKETFELAELGKRYIILLVSVH